MLPFTPRTGRSDGFHVGTPEPYYNSYVPQSEYDIGEQGIGQPDAEKSTPPESKRSLREGLFDFYGTLSWTLGFKEKYSLLLAFVFGGALIGFCLARTMMMSPLNVRDLTIPGEWFWYRQALYKPCIFIHIYLAIISGIFAVFQFLPAIRRRAMILHRINGYMTLLLLIPSTVCGSIVARRAFGGELNVQSAFYVDGLLIVLCATMGILNVKQTRKHRKWMLRTVAFAAVPITGRVVSICARYAITQIGTYYAVWRCDEVLYVLGTMNVNATQTYQQCTPPNIDTSSVFLAIRADAKGGGLGLGSSVRATFGMSLWLAIVLHTIGVETYIRTTDKSNQHRRGFVLERHETEKRKPDDS